MWTMRDVPKDLGQRILQAARLAAVLHMRRGDQERACGVLFADNESNFLIGGAGPGVCGGRYAGLPDMSKDGHLRDHGVRCAEGEPP